MLKLLFGLLAGIALFLFLVVLIVINSTTGWKLWLIIRRAKREIRRLARQRCPEAGVFSFGATKIHPRHLAIWIATQTDEHRDGLRRDQDFQKELRVVLLHAGYPPAAVPLVAFAFESQETVNRDFAGNWHYATQ